MSTNSLKDLLKTIQGDEKAAKAMDNATTGAGGPSGSYDIDLPETLEYRVEIVDTKVAPAKTSGVPQITLTFEVLEPEEFVTARFQEYYPVKPTTEGATRKIGEIMGAALVDPSPYGDDTEAYFTAFKGATVVATIRKWGGENDDERTSLRFVTSDRGQSLRTNITPQKKRGGGNPDLRPDIQIPKDEVSAPVTPPSEPETAQTPAETTSLPGGVNLPPGLGGR